MSRIISRLLIWALFCSTAISGLNAQVKPYQPAEVLLGLRTKQRANGYYYMKAWAITSSSNYVLDVAFDNGTNKTITTDGPNLAFSVKPGQLYAFQFSAGDYDWADVQFDVPAGYVLKIGRPYCPLSSRTTFRAQGAITYSVNLTLTPADGMTALAAGYSANPSLQPKVNWAISLGALPGGSWAGAVRWWQREFDASLLSNASLSYDTPIAQGVYSATYADGTLKYIDADNVQVLIERGANGGYWVKFYGGEVTHNTIGNDDYVPIMYDVPPFVTYEVSNPNGSTWDPYVGLDLKRTQPYLDDNGNPATKTDLWRIKRRLSDGATIVSQANGDRDTVVVATAPSGGQWTETTTIGSVSKIQRTYQTFSWGPEIVQEVNDPQGAALVTNYEYYTGSYQYWAPPATTGAVYWQPGDANVGKLKKIARPDGSWEFYSYYGDHARFGQLKQVLRPWGDTADETTGTAQVSTYGYAAETLASGFNSSQTSPNVQIVPGLSFLSQLAGTETQVGTTTIGRTYYASPTATADSATGNVLPIFDPIPIDIRSDYSVWPSGDAPIVARTQRAYSSNAAYQTTAARFFASWAHPDYAGKLYSQTNPDGTRTSASYHTGTYADYTDSATQWSQTGFAPGSGTARCDTFLSGAASNPGMGAVQFTTDSISTTVIDPVWMVPFKSLRTQTIYDVNSRPVLNLTYVFVGGTSFQLIGWEKRVYNSDGTLASKQTHTGERWSGTYVAGRLRTETRPDGTSTKYTYNTINQVTEREEMGQAGETPLWPDQPSLRTLFTVDLLGRVRQTTVLASNNQPGRVTSSDYNLAGQLTSETAENGLATTFLHENGGRKVTMTLPGGATKTTNYYRDGSVYSVTGTAVVAEYRTKTISGSQLIQQVNLGTTDSPRWAKSYSDWLGRTVREERPTTLAGVTFNKVSIFNTAGQLERVEETNLANTLFTYNGLGELDFSGLDVNGNGTLDLKSMDRITKSDTTIINSSGAWWSQTINYVYNQDNVVTPLQQSKQLTRLLPYAGGDYAGGVAYLQAHSYDVFGNVAVTTTLMNRPSRLVTTTTDVPDSSVDAITWTRNGLMLKKQTPQNLTFTYWYDHFRRLIGEVDPRTGNVETGYYPNGTVGAAGQVQFRKDAAGNTTNYTYQSDTGLLAWTSDPLGKQNYHTYNPRGQEIRSWGPAAYPVEYEYNDYGERTKMRTWRDSASNVNDITWGGLTYPSTTGDLTTWDYDAATGTLTSKTDAANRTVSYTYNARGQTKTRTWARTVSTTYSYYGEGSGEPLTGELKLVDYSDSTQDLSYTYNRLGQAATVSDATGMRTFSYHNSGAFASQLNQEIFGTQGSDFYGARTLTRKYDSTTGRVGFDAGYTIAGTATEQDVTHGYDAYGRFNSVASAGLTYTYGYSANSNLLSSITEPIAGWTQTRTYEPTRDLLDVIETKWSSATTAKFNYENDALGRRKNVSQSGAIFSRYVGAGAVRKWGYNDRSEVTEDKHYFGQDPALVSTLIPTRDLGYNYDNIGNRSTVSLDGSSVTYTPNALNQYDARDVPAFVDDTGFAPAAATVTVNGATAGRVGDYFSYRHGVNNSAQPSWVSDTIASSYGGSATRSTFLAKNREAFDYDEDGNLRRDGQWVYRYDAENRLVAMSTRGSPDDTQATDPSNAAVWGSGVPQRRLDFVYDYLGRRVRKTVRDWSGTAWAISSDEKFLYEGWNLTSVRNASDLSIKQSFVWGLDWSGTRQGAGGVGGLLMILDQTGGSTVFYHPSFDGNGNLVALVNRSTSGIDAVYEYDAFGQTLRAEGSFANVNPFRFSTKYTDRETQLLYYGLRYYSPSLGRFINRDPIEEEGGLNLYAFCANNGVNTWDYLGMDDYDLSQANPKYQDLIYRIIQTSKFNVPYTMASGSYWIGADAFNQYAGVWVSNTPGGPASALPGDRLTYDHTIGSSPDLSQPSSGPGAPNSSTGTNNQGSRLGDGQDGTALKLDPFIVNDTKIVTSTIDLPSNRIPGVVKDASVWSVIRDHPGLVAKGAWEMGSTDPMVQMEAGIVTGGALGAATGALSRAFIWAKRLLTAESRLGTLVKVGENTWESSGGLRYAGLDRNGLNRIEHVLEHTIPNASKPIHSVFNVSRNQVLALLDEAWGSASRVPIPNNPGAFVTPMERVVGTAGENAVQIVVRPGTNQVITAYPIKWP